MTLLYMGKEHLISDWLRLAGVQSVAANLRDRANTLVRERVSQH
jgi:hypothetical protein